MKYNWWLMINNSWSMNNNRRLMVDNWWSVNKNGSPVYNNIWSVVYLWWWMVNDRRSVHDYVFLLFMDIFPLSLMVSFLGAHL